MLCYCLKCRENTKIKNSKVVKTKNRTLIIFSKGVFAIVNNRN